MRALPGRVIIQADSFEKAGSIILPADREKNNNPKQGVIVAVGENPYDLNIGDRVCMTIYPNFTYMDNGVKLYVYNADDILGIIDERKAA